MDVCAKKHDAGEGREDETDVVVKSKMIYAQSQPHIRKFKFAPNSILVAISESLVPDILPLSDYSVSSRASSVTRRGGRWVTPS